MSLFKQVGSTLNEVAPKKIAKEKDIQKLTEDNLNVVFGLEFLVTEFAFENLRFDTVAFDPATKSFVVIEYKRDSSFSVVDQGYAYMSLVLNYKAEFVLLYNEVMQKTLRKNDIDWSQTRVMFVAQDFTAHQRQAINFRDMPIELWKVTMFSNDTVLYDQLKPRATSESIKTVTKDPTVQKVNSEVKVYEIEDHFLGAKEAEYDLYETLRDAMKAEFPDINENPRKFYIGFAFKEKGTDTIITAHIQTNKIKIEIPRIRPADVNDPSRRIEYIKNSHEQFNTPYSTMILEDAADVDYLMSIVKQVYKKFFDKRN